MIGSPGIRLGCPARHGRLNGAIPVVFEPREFLCPRSFWTVGPKVMPPPSISRPCIHLTAGCAARIAFSTLSQASFSSDASTWPDSLTIFPSLVLPLYHHRKQNEPLEWTGSSGFYVVSVSFLCPFYVAATQLSVQRLAFYRPAMVADAAHPSSPAGLLHSVRAAARTVPWSGVR